MGNGGEQEPVIHDADYVEAFESFLEENHLSELERILLLEDESKHYSVHVDFAELLEAHPKLSHELYFQPGKVLPLFDAAALAVLQKLDKGNKVMKRVHVRLVVQGSALERPEVNPSIGRIRVKHLGKLVTLKGTIIRSGGVKILEGEREYECTKCKRSFKLFPELETGSGVELPRRCPSQRTKPCTGSTFRCIEDSKVSHDYQEIKMQENLQTLGVGSVPRSIVAILQDDLVDTVQAGDDVVATGELFSRWRRSCKDARCDIEIMLRVNYVRKANDLKAAVDVPDDVIHQFEQFWKEFERAPFKGRNAILQSICPQVYGLFTVKLAVALTLVGGVQRVDSSGTRIRGESHLLLVGDPGTGKSQFLKYAARLSHRSVVTTGLGSTSAGLTVTAVKDGGEWMLEAGALVLADGGLCCIDEFDSIREADRATIHEAMEQQTLSVAKAGLVTTLNTRTTVFGVTNPKGQYDPQQPLSVNTTLSGPLLSRFDIVLVLLDTKNPEWDTIVSSHILSEHMKQKSVNCVSNLTGFWTLAMLRRYILYVRDHIRPVLTAEAEKIIISYYQLQRRAGAQNAARTTIRMLESLIRLAQAHAKLMYRRQVTRADAIAAIVCVESSMTTSAILDDVGNALHSTFSEKPDAEYTELERKILVALGLNRQDPSNRGPVMQRCSSLVNQVDTEAGIIFPTQGHQGPQ
ncbi:probable DNA helicase MCM9 [Selaginella moellendorffii]|uniref:probable DNA helicase MCM9 n=1 Tax=Selaginella moellendorffii TaxID=88036 RepID=UPI000D1CC700|nr:probable DNA helicase MCM9 [Selaginella moellendorffii]|eukprot:XP_024518384.1 probable DNA helicase MCM9 [Selaginella moellendorffii]